VTFQHLGPATIEAITRKELEELGKREGFAAAGVRLRYSDALVRWLARVGFDARYGARPLQRVLERRLVAPLARFLLTHPNLREKTLDLDYASPDRVLLDGSEMGSVAFLSQ